MRKEIIRQTLRIHGQQEFKGKKRLFDLLVCALILLPSLQYRPMAVPMNLVLLMVIAFSSHRFYTLFERSRCAYLLQMKSLREGNIRLVCCVWQCLPYLLILAAQLFFFFPGSRYWMALAAVAEFLLAVGWGIVSVCFGEKIGRLLPVLFFAFFLVLTWEQNEQLHLISPKALLYHLERPSDFGLAGVFGTAASLFLVPTLRRPKRAGVLAVSAACVLLLLGGLTYAEYRRNREVENSGYRSLENGQGMRLQYKGIEEGQAERMFLYVGGIFTELAKCGLEVPDEFILEKYVGDLFSHRKSYCEYDGVGKRFRMVVTSDGLFQEDGELLTEFLNKGYRSYMASFLVRDSKLEKNWLFAAWYYASYRFAKTAEESEQTRSMKQFVEDYRRLEEGLERSDDAADQLLLETMREEPSAFYERYQALVERQF
ncbi:MAG: hypothetical protein LBQ15_03345 [Clostridium sp.]|jgi:hypothetical protein|nr:hypothetical protein [Clostridium sp.]